MSPCAMEGAFSEFKLSLGADARFYIVRVTLVGGGYENDWPLESVSFAPGVLLLSSSGKACLIPTDRIDKVFMIDNRMNKENFK